MSKRIETSEKSSAHPSPYQPNFRGEQDSNLSFNLASPRPNVPQDNYSLFGSVRNENPWYPQLNFDSTSQFSRLLAPDQVTNGDWLVNQTQPRGANSPENRFSEPNQFPWANMENCSMMPKNEYPTYVMNDLDSVQSTNHRSPIDHRAAELRSPREFNGLENEVIFDAANLRTQSGHSVKDSQKSRI